mmetsp:Transcript_73066/g.138114  ORF Transcript_73066/g.138114 Transcript_73066/m.138114 type:complete len:296 (-) Transcript_73066:132-1019(-)
MVRGKGCIKIFFRTRFFLWCLGFAFGGALCGHGVHMLIRQHPLGVCSVKAKPAELETSAICKSWSHERGTSWALRFKGDVVHWNDEVGQCDEFLAVRFAGERGSQSEAACQQRAKELAAEMTEHDRCILDKDRGLCYVQCACKEEARQNTSIMAWLFLIAGASGAALAVASMVLDTFQKLTRSSESVHREQQANISQEESRWISEVEIEQHLPAIRIGGSHQCVVCLSSVMESEMARQLQCGHVFHASCILDWWMHRPRKTLECPVCKQIHQMPRSESAPVHDGQVDGQVIGVGV